ncbi:hypothetical protein LEMLEM_LOCUS1909 [Lemmus lemmus]
MNKQHKNVNRMALSRPQERLFGCKSRSKGVLPTSPLLER